MRYDAEHILDRLVADGGRRSAARVVIVDELLRAGSHFTAEDLAERVRKRSPTVNRSTVYRTLDVLERIGVLDHVHLGHGRAVYHRGDEDHQHLVCERCQRVEELPAAKLRTFEKMLERDFSFVVDRRHFAIVGLCSTCRDA